MGSQGQGTDWSRASLAELTRHIAEHHHVHTLAEAARLRRLATRALRAEGGSSRAEALARLRKALSRFRKEAKAHFALEEAVFFPFIRALEALHGAPAPEPPSRRVRGAVRSIQIKHAELDKAMHEIMALLGSELPTADGSEALRGLHEGLDVLEADPREHIRLENHILFPRALELEPGINPVF